MRGNNSISVLERRCRERLSCCEFDVLLFELNEKAALGDGYKAYKKGDTC